MLLHYKQQPLNSVKEIIFHCCGNLSKHETKYTMRKFTVLNAKLLVNMATTVL